MAADNSFQERLNRIQGQRGTASAYAGAPAPLPPRRQGRSARTIFRIAIPAGLLAAATVFVLSSTADIGATLQNATGIKADRGSVAGLVMKFFGPASAHMPEAPADFLPTGSDGWLRVTQQDVQDPDFQSAFAARWPAQGHDLTRNAGYEHLQHFVQTYAEPDVEIRVLSAKRTRALYLHPDGSFLEVRLNFLNRSQSLGTMDNPRGWIESLRAREGRNIAFGDLLEELELGGIPVINRTKEPGKSLISRPIGEALDAPNGLRLSAPLANRALIEISGIARPSAAADILRAIDRKSLIQRVNR